MAYSVDVSIDQNLREFLDGTISKESNWAYKDDILSGYVTDLIGFLLGEEDINGDTEVSVSFVTTDKIHELNKQYRDVDRPTDVLSFPCDTPEETPDELTELGDLVLSPEVISAQSKEYGTSYLQELTLLITHGTLHLLGYDHIEDDDAEKMQRRERELLEAWEKIS